MVSGIVLSLSNLTHPHTSSTTSLHFFNMLSTISTLAFASAACASALPVSKTAPQMPLYYEYGGYPRIQTNISWGTPAQAPIPVIFDTGSVAFWTYGPKAIINDGSQYLGSQGPCNKTVKKIFNWPSSTSHSPVVNLTSGNVYSYGGNGKLISAYQEINDTMNFVGTGFQPIKNTQVAISNFTIVRQLDNDCAIDVNTFDQSILGVGPFNVGGVATSRTGPSLKVNMKYTGQTSTNILSMWMCKAPADVRGTYHGTALFGQPLPKSAYSGSVVEVKQMPPNGSYVGYYTALPSFTIGGKAIGVKDTTVENCLIDSGTGQDQLPFSLADVTKNSKVFEYQTKEGFVLTAYNGSCDSIPATETFDFKFPGAKSGQSAVVKLPIRSYARGTSDSLTNIPKNICALTLSLDNYGGCVFGAPFFTAAALQFDDDKKEILMAQGGI